MGVQSAAPATRSAAIPPHSTVRIWQVGVPNCVYGRPCTCSLPAPFFVVRNPLHDQEFALRHRCSQQRKRLLLGASGWRFAFSHRMFKPNRGRLENRILCLAAGEEAID
jgi:hypothetical protein